MTSWLIKSEPVKYAWSQMQKDGRTNWNGVRNFQAANHLRQMKLGDEAFFYHSNDGKEIVGVVKVVKEAYPDPSDESGKFVMVDVAPVKALSKPVTLAMMKDQPSLKNFQLLRQSRLSVCQVTDDEWKIIMKMSGA